MKNPQLRHFYAAFFVLSSVFANASYAWPPTFGGEFTFTSEEMKAAQTAGNVVNNPVSEKARDQMGELMIERCKTAVPRCQVIQGANKYGVGNYRVVYEDGWWYQIETDPSVVEIQTKGATYEQLAKMETRIQRDIFDLASEVGLSSSENVGGGHIHIGMHSALDGNANLFRNFFVDYSNHSELGTGVMSFLGNGNAPTLGELTEAQRASFNGILRDFDRGRIKEPKDFASRVQKEVYYTNPNHWSPPEKYQALNVTRMVDKKMSEEERTFELRAFPGQRDAHDFLLQTGLLHRRLELLRGFDGRIPFQPASVYDSAGIKAARFYRYVTDAGLKWDDYSHYVGVEYRHLAPKMGCDLQLLGGVP